MFGFPLFQGRVPLRKIDQKSGCWWKNKVDQKLSDLNGGFGIRFLVEFEVELPQFRENSDAIWSLWGHVKNQKIDRFFFIPGAGALKP